VSSPPPAGDPPPYRDRRIECRPDGLAIHAYYFPWGTKRIAYQSIRAIHRVELAASRGRARIWGTANPRYWAHLDPSRPKKAVGFVLELGRPVHPFLTPDDPDAFAACLEAKTGKPVEQAKSPII
jgi:hypothetical protein